MTAPPDMPIKSRRKPWLGLLLIIPVGLLAASWYFTEPLTDHPAPLPAKPAEVARLEPTKPDAPVEWPEGPVEGDPAKKLLLASARRSVDQLGRIPGYTATLRKEERIGGKLGPEQTLAMKVRNHPFAIYLKFLAPKAGKEVVYAEGHHDNKVIAHNGDWTRKLIPRLAVPPDSPLALADSRHPVTEAGLLHLAQRLLKFREMDMGDPHATTVMDRTTEDGLTYLRSVHIHTKADGSRPFARVEILYDPVTQYPIKISSYDWPAPGHLGELDLAERFGYSDIKFDAVLTPADFDMTNPEYGFMRF